MLDYVKAGEGIDYIIVYKLSCFGRNTRAILDAFELIHYYGIDLIYVEDQVAGLKIKGVRFYTLNDGRKALEQLGKIA